MCAGSPIGSAPAPPLVDMHAMCEGACVHTCMVGCVCVCLCVCVFVCVSASILGYAMLWCCCLARHPSHPGQQRRDLRDFDVRGAVRVQVLPRFQEVLHIILHQKQAARTTRGAGPSVGRLWLWPQGWRW